jgi:probable phosphomutase (TIGR03848 family)
VRHCTYPNLYSTGGVSDETGHTGVVRSDLPLLRRAVTTFLLIRHAMCDPVGRAVVGRTPGVHLNQAGRSQAERLAERLSRLSLAALYSSPLERALETARPIGLQQELPVQTLEGFNEIDFGDWTGKSLQELDQVSDWRSFNSFRSGSRIPGGENMAEVLSRVLRDLDRLRAAHPGPETLVAVVSHGDVLRVTLAHALGLAVDFLQRLELSPASVSAVGWEDYGTRLLQMNSTDGWPPELCLRSSR